LTKTSRNIQTAVALAVLIAAAGTLAVVIRKYRRDVDACRLLYTRSIKKKDIVDSARNALSALNDAELREQNYVLTGETVYSEAYADDIRAWQDESASLGLVAVKDRRPPSFRTSQTRERAWWANSPWSPLSTKKTDAILRSIAFARAPELSIWTRSEMALRRFRTSTAEPPMRPRQSSRGLRDRSAVLRKVESLSSCLRPPARCF
jgi:hypothetical protein